MRPLSLSLLSSLSSLLSSSLSPLPPSLSLSPRSLLVLTLDSPRLNLLSAFSVSHLSHLLLASFSFPLSSRICLPFTLANADTCERNLFAFEISTAGDSWTVLTVDFAPLGGGEGSLVASLVVSSAPGTGLDGSSYGLFELLPCISLSLRLCRISHTINCLFSLSLCVSRIEALSFSLFLSLSLSFFSFSLFSLSLFLLFLCVAGVDDSPVAEDGHPAQMCCHSAKSASPFLSPPRRPAARHRRPRLRRLRRRRRRRSSSSRRRRKKTKKEEELGMRTRVVTTWSTRARHGPARRLQRRR